MAFDERSRSPSMVFARRLDLGRLPARFKIWSANDRTGGTSGAAIGEFEPSIDGVSVGRLGCCSTKGSGICLPIGMTCAEGVRRRALSRCDICRRSRCEGGARPEPDPCRFRPKRRSHRSGPPGPKGVNDTFMRWRVPRGDERRADRRLILRKSPLN